MSVDHGTHCLQILRCRFSRTSLHHGPGGARPCVDLHYLERHVNCQGGPPQAVGGRGKPPRWVFSLYFDETNIDGSVEELLKASNEGRASQAQTYLSHLNANESVSWHRERLHRDSSLDLLVVVKTVDRSRFNNNPPTNYLLQVVVGLDREIRRLDCGTFCVGLIMCNVDSNPQYHREASVLSRFYPSMNVPPSNGLHPSPTQDVRETEKRHLVGCLQSVARFRARYLLMVEDDAEPYPGAFTHLRYVLRDHLETRLLHGERVEEPKPWAFLKLYYPERWSGFSWQFSHVCELCTIGCLVGSFCVLLVVCWNQPRSVPTIVLWLHLALGASYGIMVAVAVGRQHLLQLRRLGAGIVTVGEAPGCCTPAVVYPWQIVQPAVQFLTNVTCTSNYGVDLALDHFSKNAHLHQFLVEPNLFHHRGVYSTLTKPKNMVEFLFDLD